MMDSDSDSDSDDSRNSGSNNEISMEQIETGDRTLRLDLRFDYLDSKTFPKRICDNDKKKEFYFYHPIRDHLKACDNRWISAMNQWGIVCCYPNANNLICPTDTPTQFLNDYMDSNKDQFIDQSNSRLRLGRLKRAIKKCLPITEVKDYSIQIIRKNERLEFKFEFFSRSEFLIVTSNHKQTDISFISDGGKVTKLASLDDEFISIPFHGFYLFGVNGFVTMNLNLIQDHPELDLCFICHNRKIVYLLSVPFIQNCFSKFIDGGCRRFLVLCRFMMLNNNTIQWQYPTSMCINFNREQISLFHLKWPFMSESEHHNKSIISSDMQQWLSRPKVSSSDIVVVQEPLLSYIRHIDTVWELVAASRDNLFTFHRSIKRIDFGKITKTGANVDIGDSLHSLPLAPCSFLSGYAPILKSVIDSKQSDVIELIQKLHTCQAGDAIIVVSDICQTSFGSLPMTGHLLNGLFIVIATEDETIESLNIHWVMSMAGPSAIVIAYFPSRGTFIYHSGECLDIERGELIDLRDVRFKLKRRMEATPLRVPAEGGLFDSKLYL